MTQTANLALPEIAAAQAQKHVTHNEALRALDALVQLAVLDRTHASPPGAPAEGQRWIVAASPTGAWAGHAGHVAAWQDGGWDFHVPRVGWLAYVIAEGALVAWSGSAWVDALALLTALQNIALLGVGTTADATNPFSAKLNNALWTAKTVAEGGDGHLRYKMSKESAAKTLSLLMQTNFSGRAEIGLTGDDDLHVKVSADGASWLDALIVDKSTARLTLAQGFADPAATRAQVAAAPLDALAFNGMQVNGGMELSQENVAASVTLTATPSLQTKYLLDQVMAAYRGTFVAAAQQVSDAPPGYRNSLKLTVSTAQGSLGANDELSILVPFEGLRVARLAYGTASARAVSLAFWVKAHRTGGYSGSLRNAGKTRAYPFAFVVNAADSWEYKAVTVTLGDTAGTWASDTGVGLYLNFCIAAGASRLSSAGAWSGSDLSGASGTTNGVAATSDVFQLTGLVVLPGIELPAADRAPLVMRPFDAELACCLRYWEKTYEYGVALGSDTAALGYGSGVKIFSAPGEYLMGMWRFNVEKRAPPMLSYWDRVGNASRISTLLLASGWTNNVTPADGAGINSRFAQVTHHAANMVAFGVDMAVSARL